MSSVKQIAGDIILNKLEAIKARADNSQETTIKECDFVLNCYKAFISEQVAQRFIDISSIPTDDLKEAYRQYLTMQGQLKLIED